MALIIKSNVVASFLGALGHHSQGHLQYAVNMGAWWLFYTNSSTTMDMLCNYSQNPTQGSWFVPGGSPYTTSAANSQCGMDYGLAYANIASTDIFHMVSMWDSSQAGGKPTNVSRFTITGLPSTPTFHNTNAETALVATSALTPLGQCMIVDEQGYPFWTDDASAGGQARPATNQDTGTSWSTGTFDGNTFTWPQGQSGPQNECFNLARLGSGNILAVFDNNGVNGVDAMTGLVYAVFTQANPRSNSATSAFAAVPGSTVTQTDQSFQALAGRTTSDIHVWILSNNNNSFLHLRFNGSSWSAGDSIQNFQIAQGPSGNNFANTMAMETDGTNVWAIAGGSDFTIQYNKWTSGVGWGGWNVLEPARPGQPYNVIAKYSPQCGGIAVAWGEQVDSSHVNIAVSFLQTQPSPAFPVFPDRAPAPQRAARYDISLQAIPRPLPVNTFFFKHGDVVQINWTSGVIPSAAPVALISAPTGPIGTVPLVTRDQGNTWTQSILIGASYPSGIYTVYVQIPIQLFQVI